MENCNREEVTDIVDFSGSLPAEDIIYFDKPGQASLKKISFEGIRLLYGRLRFIRQSPVRIVSFGPYIEMLFLLSGSREMLFTESGTRARVSGGQHNLFYIPDTEFYLEPSLFQNESISMQVQFAEDYFNRFMPIENPLFAEFIARVQARQAVAMNVQSPSITPEMYSLLEGIVHCPREGFTKQLFIETSVLKLLLLQFDQYQIASGQRKNSKIKLHDVEKFEMVRAMLEENIAAAHSLGELSRKSGLNDFKLKKGFKELYGTTVFGYLNQLRMAKAQELLHNGTFSVAEIAEQCGYAYVQSFSTAFKKWFGVSPEKFRQ